MKIYSRLHLQWKPPIFDDLLKFFDTGDPWQDRYKGRSHHRRYKEICPAEDCHQYLAEKERPRNGPWRGLFIGTQASQVPGYSSRKKQKDREQQAKTEIKAIIGVARPHDLEVNRLHRRQHRFGSHPGITFCAPDVIRESETKTSITKWQYDICCNLLSKIVLISPVF